MRFKALCFIFILTFSIASFAQNNTHVFHQLNLKDGLSEATVRTITEDKNGYMWFGTESGLNKYDGYDFTIYINGDSPYSISSNNIKTVLNDSKGNLWIGTRHGLNLYDHKQDRFYNYSADTLLALKYIKGDIEDIIEDRDGTIWVLAGNDGLFKITSLERKPICFKFLTNDYASGLISGAPDELNNIWIGTLDGLLYFDTHTNAFIDKRNQYGKGYHIREMHFDKNKILWLATTKGLKKINTTTGVLTEYVHSNSNPNSLKGNNTAHIIPDKENLLIGIDGSGMDEFDPKTEIFYHNTTDNGSDLSSNNINSIFKDSKGTLWVGTFLNGINFSNSTTNFFVSVNNKPKSPQDIAKGIISAFLEDSKGNFWVTTDGGGVYLKEKNKSEFINFNIDDANPIIGANAVISIIEDQDGTIWLGTYDGGLTAYKSRNDFKIYRHKNSDSTSVVWDQIKSICEFNNEIWVSTYGMGISIFNKKTQTFRHYKNIPNYKNFVPSSWVNILYKDSEGVLWLGTYDGMCKYLPETNTFQTYIFESSIYTDKNHVFDIFEDSQNNFWIATHGGGLLLFDRKTGAIKRYTTENGLSDNSLKTIIEDNYGNLWLASKHGIAKFNIYTKKGIPYDIVDGLPSGSFFPNSKFKDKKGKIYFGTNNGYLKIDPLLSSDKVDFPKVVLTEFKIFNTTIKPNVEGSPLKNVISEANSVHLNYNQNTISFEFAALNFIIPKQNHYAYKLEGFDTEWTYADKNRTAKYTNLNPGVYIFKVKASNNKNKWSNFNITQFKITIHPPYWATWWFRSLTIVFILSIIIIVFSIRTHSIKKRNAWLKTEVDTRTKELILNKEQLEISNQKLANSNELHKRLIAIIGHDVRGPLHQFSLLFKYMDADSSEWALATMKEMASSISLLATDLLDWATLAGDEIELKTTNFTWSEIITKALKELEPSIESKKIQFEQKINDTTTINGVYPIVLSAIRNVLSNAIRFSPQNATIELEATLTQNGYSCLRITDFGTGLNVADVNKMIQGDAFKGKKESSLTNGAGLGMAICYDMLRRTGGWLEAGSLPNSGATFYIYIPLTYKKISTRT
jgi:two-component system, sensor histidine kinase ChiS